MCRKISGDWISEVRLAEMMIRQSSGGTAQSKSEEQLFHCGAYKLPLFPCASIAYESIVSYL